MILCSFKHKSIFSNQLKAKSKVGNVDFLQFFSFTLRSWFGCLCGAFGVNALALSVHYTEIGRKPFYFRRSVQEYCVSLLQKIKFLLQLGQTVTHICLPQLYYMNERPEQPIKFYTITALNNKKNIDKVLLIVLNTHFFNSS